jgi:hypothetical protein
MKFLAYGDSRTQFDIHDQVAAAMVSLRAADPRFRTFTANMGDLVSDGGNESDWDVEFFNPGLEGIQGLLNGAPYHSVMGNHDLPGDLFGRYFPYPYVGDRYWSFDYGPAHILVLDQYTDYAPGSPEYAWIVSDLASTTKLWKLILLHEPGWSAGGGHGNNTLVQDFIQPLCLEYGVVMVLAGHNHYYARAVVDGVQHVTTGGGGAPLHTPDSGYPHVVAAEEAHHYCCIEIDGARLRLAAVALEGDTLDTVETEAPSGLSSGAIDASPGAVRAFPNPFTGRTTIHLDPPPTERAGLWILDVRGGVIRSFSAGQVASGIVSWDGTGQWGRTVPPGVYFLRSGRSAMIREKPAPRLVLVR